MRSCWRSSRPRLWSGRCCASTISLTYPLKFVAAGRHYYQFWSKTPQEITWRDGVIQYQRAPIDTTFGMYRKGFTFRRQNPGLRVYAPYWARHLDWYIDPSCMAG